MSRGGGLLLGVSVVWVPLAFLTDGVTVLMLPLRLGGDATSLGLVSFAGIAIAALAQIVAGRWSDTLRATVGRRAFIAVAAVPALAGLAGLVTSSGIVAAVVAYVVLQVGAAAIQAGQQSLIPEHVAADARGRAAGLKSAFDVGGSFLAFLVLGALLARGALGPAAIVVAVSLLAAIAMVGWLVPAGPAGVGGAAERTRLLDLPPGLAALILSRFLFLFGTYAVGRFLVLLTATRLGVPIDRAVEASGGLLALLTLVTAASALVFGRLVDRSAPSPLLVGGSVLAGSGILLLVPGLGLPGLIAGGLLMAIGTGAFVTANWAATTMVVPAGSAGRLMAIANLGTGLAAAGAGLLGPLVDAAGFTPALLIAALATALAIAPVVAPRRLPARLGGTPA